MRDLPAVRSGGFGVRRQQIAPRPDWWYRYRLIFVCQYQYYEILDQRRTQRYKLQLPLYIFQLGDERVDRTAKTRDISSGGVCFLSGTSFEVGGRIDYMITLSGSNPPVRIRCLGKVLRSQKPGDDAPYEVAVTMERYSFVKAEELTDLAIPA